jgi:hypothetical protein
MLARAVQPQPLPVADGPRHRHGRCRQPALPRPPGRPDDHQLRRDGHDLLSRRRAVPGRGAGERRSKRNCARSPRWTRSSTSSTGVSSVVVELYDTLSGEEIERAWSEVRDALDDAARVSARCTGPGIRQRPHRGLSCASSPHLGHRATTSPVRCCRASPTSSPSAARNFPGTKLVELFGEASEEIRVDIDEQACSPAASASPSSPRRCAAPIRAGLGPRQRQTPTTC